jgi:long-chain acyl-CoA synthetase
MENKTTTLNDLITVFDELKKINPLLAINEREIKGSTFNVFTNAPKTFRELYDTVVLLMGDFPFVNENGNQLNFLEIIQKSKNLANYLSSKGITKDDSVGICMQNCTEWIIAYIGITAHGAKCVPFNSWWTKDELSYGIPHSEVKLVFTDQKRFEIIKDFKVDIVLNGKFFNETIEQHYDTWPEENASDEDYAVLLYTSGSTGVPKGVMLSHLSLINALLGFVSYGEIFKKITGDNLLEAENASVIVNVPLFHVTGLVTQFLLSMLAKRNLFLIHKWDPLEALKLIDKFKVTNISGVPTQSWELLNHPDVDNYDLSSLIDIGAGGAARPKGQVESLMKKFNTPLTFAWGMTETCALGAIHRGDDYLKRPTSCGLPLPYITELGVIDDNWNFLEPLEIGEIVYKSPTNFIGYLKNSEETNKTLKNGWLRTGDLGYLDKDGYLFISDRKKALIIRGGENISTLEVENALDNIQGVLESCVCGLNDERLGEVVGAMIYTKINLSEDSIKDALRDQLARYKIPEIIKFTDAPLPRIASEKIDRVGIKKNLSS